MLLRKALFPVLLALLAPFLPTTISQLSHICSLPQGASSRQSQVSLAPLTNPEMRSAYNSIAVGAQKFGMEFLTQISDNLEAANSQENFMVSPFSVWSLLLLLLETVKGNTLQEMRTTLHIQDDLLVLRAAVAEIQKFLLTKASTVDVRTLQGIFVDNYEQFPDLLIKTLEECYSAHVYRLNFNDTERTKDFINKKISDITQGLIKDVISTLQEDVRMLLTSTLYFKGQWKLPFNKSDTHKEPFYDERGIAIGEVDMMFQMSPLNYTSMNELEGHVLELPYGNENRLCMLAILPRKGISLNQIVHNLNNIGVSAILQKIAADLREFGDEEVEVYLPRFSTSTKFPLKGPIEALGIKDLFDPAHVQYSMLSQSLYVKDIFHNTKIIVNEEGTEAAAVTTAVLANKASPPKFYFNRPFLYLIVEKRTNLLLFAGQVTNTNFT